MYSHSDLNVVCYLAVSFVDNKTKQHKTFSLYPANLIFVGEYITTEGKECNKDHQMIRNAGFEIDYVTNEEETTIG
ncbi:hypothetical protein [Pontibacillus marinus]|uniref:hypothetical protein n=1 Tax=Pontibacillus marinus TaxID=273164 RepID=UPI002D21BA55|nr:hypothetical protein [Pontibacillus marinus]